MTDPTDFDLLFADITDSRGGVERFSPRGLAIARKLAMALADPDSPPSLITSLEEMLESTATATGEPLSENLQPHDQRVLSAALALARFPGSWKRNPARWYPLIHEFQQALLDHPFTQWKLGRTEELRRQVAEWRRARRWARENAATPEQYPDAGPSAEPQHTEGRQRAPYEAGGPSRVGATAVAPITELPRSAHAGLVLITEMKAAYLGGPIRPVERWVSREEHDKIERLRRLGEVPPQPSGPPPTPREQYEREMMDAAHRDAAGDGLYGNFVASYERGDP
jgi:hypothetical protein